MQNVYEPLQSLIESISEKTKAHVCIHDISGILKNNSLNLDFANQRHSKGFCSAAKTSPKGFKACIGCKMRANQKAIIGQRMFCGYCYYGLYEVVKPVVINNKTQCIIYIGNLVYDYDKLSRRIHQACEETEAPENKILSHLSECQTITSDTHYIKLANIIDSYIRLLYEYDKEHNNGKKPVHWAVSTLKNYIEANFTDNITLENASNLYFINSKYIGRLFKKQTGYTFHEYLNKVRLDHAVALLLNTNESIIYVAMHSGFQNVTYFNRVFLKRYNMTPNQYRITHSL